MTRNEKGRREDAGMRKYGMLEEFDTRGRAKGKQEGREKRWYVAESNDPKELIKTKESE
jgi:hypothetical protein